MRDRTTVVGTDRGARLTGIVLLNVGFALVLTALYFLILGVLGLHGLTTRETAHVVATVAVALLVIPLRARLLALCNQLLRRRWQSDHDLIHEVGTALAAADSTSLAALLLDDLPARLGFSGAALWILEPPDDRAFAALREPREAEGAILLEHGAAVRQLRAVAEWIAVPSQLSAEWAAPFSARRLTVVVPLRAGQTLIGIYGLAYRLEQAPIPAATMALLRALAPSIAVALAHLRAQATIARLDDRVRTLDQLKDEFVESVGHELRTPLTTLHLSLELLMAQPGISPPLARIMSASTMQLHSLINRVLTFETHMRRSDPQQAASMLIDLETLIEELTESYIDLIQSRGLQLEVRTVRGLMAWGVPSRLLRALREVLDNAVRFSSSGTLSIHTELRDGLAVIHIIDQGAGIPEDERDRLFTAFYRGRGVRALADTPGAGLGLSIAQSDIEALGGRIWIERSDERGTQVCVALAAVVLGEDELTIDPPRLQARALGQKR